MNRHQRLSKYWLVPVTDSPLFMFVDAVLLPVLPICFSVGSLKIITGDSLKELSSELIKGRGHLCFSLL